MKRRRCPRLIWEKTETLRCNKTRSFSFFQSLTWSTGIYCTLFVSFYLYMLKKWITSVGPMKVFGLQWLFIWILVVNHFHCLEIIITFQCDHFVKCASSWFWGCFSVEFHRIKTRHWSEAFILAFFHNEEFVHFEIHRWTFCQLMVEKALTR